MNGAIGTAAVRSHRVYGKQAGTAMADWLEKNERTTEAGPMAWDAMPAKPSSVQTVLRFRHAATYNASMENRDLKEEAKRLIDSLPSLNSWEQLMHEIYVRESIEAGLADSRDGRTSPVKDVRAEFGLPE